MVKKMIKYDYKFNNLDETMAFAKRMGEHLFPGAILTFEGELGSGKTTFTKGLALGLGITKTVNSPTFTIVKTYEGRLVLNHIDAYRMENEEEDLGLDEFFFGDGVTVVEWASKIAPQIPDEFLHICFYRMGENVRVIEAFPQGERYIKLCEAVFNE